MENLELKEKLLCALKSNIEDIKELRERYENGARFFWELFYLDKDSIRIKILKRPVYKKEIVEKAYNIKRKYFWQKDKVKIESTEEWNLDYIAGEIIFENVKFDLTKEEYEEIINLRQEKIKEKQLEELDKLCNNELQ